MYVYIYILFGHSYFNPCKILFSTIYGDQKLAYTYKHTYHLATTPLFTVVLVPETLEIFK